MRGIKGMIFDMDGTMVDNMMVHHRAWQAALREEGIDWPLERVQQEVHGVNEEILLRLFGEKFTAADRKRVSGGKEAAYRRIYAPELKAVDGVIEFIDRAAALHVPLAIATAAPAENADFLLDALALRDRFTAIVNAGHVSNGKPHPEVVNRAAAGLGLEAADCLFFEDSPTGAGAGQNAGSHVLILTTTHEPTEFAGYTTVRGFLKDFSGLEIRPLEEDGRFGVWDGMGVRLV